MYVGPARGWSRGTHQVYTAYVRSSLGSSPPAMAVDGVGEIRLSAE